MTLRHALRRALLWLSPAPPLPGPSIESVARLAAEVASLRQRAYAAEVSLAEWQRQTQALTKLVAMHSRDLAHVCAGEASRQGTLGARVARIELLIMPPIADCAATDGRLDEALEAIALHGGGRDA